MQKRRTGAATDLLTLRWTTFWAKWIGSNCPYCKYLSPECKPLGNNGAAANGSVYEALLREGAVAATPWPPFTGWSFGQKCGRRYCCRGCLCEQNMREWIDKLNLWKGNKISTRFLFTYGHSFVIEMDGHQAAGSSFYCGGVSYIGLSGGRMAIDMEGAFCRTGGGRTGFEVQEFAGWFCYEDLFVTKNINQVNESLNEMTTEHLLQTGT